MAAILKICKLTLFPGSDSPRLFFWDSVWPIKAVKAKKCFVAIFWGWVISGCILTRLQVKFDFTLIPRLAKHKQNNTLYTVGRLVTLPYEMLWISNPSLQIRDRGQSMVCVHTYSESDNALLCVAEIWPFEVFHDGHLKFDPTGNGAVRSAVPENPTLEPNMQGIGWHVAELWPFEIFPKCVNWPWGRSSVGRQYSYFLHWSHILLFRYVRDVAREE